DHGLLDPTLARMMGEMGRTPQINSRAGRDKRSLAQSILWAGGAATAGQGIGATDDPGAYPTTEQFRGDDLLPTRHRQPRHDPTGKVALTGPLGEFPLPPPPYWSGPKAGDAQPPLAREVPARITLPADLPAGTIKFQDPIANGGSAPIEFAVSDATEIVEP